MKRKILVTGGAGFIGSHTAVKLHEAGFTPIVVDNFCNSERAVVAQLDHILGTPVIVHELDCSKEGSLTPIFAQHPDIWGVIHFAAYKAVGESVRQPAKYYANNIGSLLEVNRAMKAANVAHLVFSSSCTVYGQPDTLPVTETTPLQPAGSPYGYTKQVCERILTDLAADGTNSSNSVLLRYFNPIGAHPSGRIGELPLGVPENLVPYITQTAAGLRDSLTVFGNNYDTNDGTCVRDYIHVLDLAAAHVKALEWLDGKQGVCEAFNLGTGNGNTVLEVIASFERVSGVSLNHSIGPRRPGDVEKIYAGAAKAERELGWKTTLSLDQAMLDAWNWQLRLQEKAAQL